MPIGGDVTFTVGVDDAFDLVVNGQSVLQFINGTDFREFTVVVPGLPQGLVPITLNFGELGGEANLVLSASGGGLPGGVIPQEFLLPPSAAPIASGMRSAGSGSRQVSLSAAAADRALTEKFPIAQRLDDVLLHQLASDRASGPTNTSHRARQRQAR